MPTREEVAAARARLGLAPARSDQQQQRGGFQKPPGEAVPLPVQQKPSRGGVRGFVGRLTKPLVDVPELPGGFLGDIVEEGIESVTSPVGLLTSALVPITGGGSLALKAGIGGVAKTLGGRFAASAVAGGVGGKAAEEVNERLPEGTPGILRIPATFGAAVVAGGATGAAAGRLLGSGRAAARAAAATPEAMAEQAMGGYTPAANEFIKAFQGAKARLKDPLVKRAVAEENRELLGGRIRGGFAAADKSGAYGQAYTATVKSGLRGPMQKLDFPELNMPAGVLDDLTDEAMHSPKLLPLEQVNASDALLKAVVGRISPTPYEMELLDRVFGPAFVQAATKDPSFIKAALNGIVNLPRAVLATMDLSWPLNQGLLLSSSNPGSWRRSMGVAARSMVDPQYAKEMDDWVRNGSNSVEAAKHAAAAQAGLHITGGARPTEEFAVAGATMGKLFSNNLAGKVLSGSERAYTTPQNYLRTKVWDKTLDRLTPQYAKAGDTAEEAIARIPYIDKKRLADTINTLSGRSPWLQGAVGHKYGPTLNALMFAPHYVMSRFQAPFLPAQSLRLAVERGGLKSLADPISLWKSDPILQLQAKSLGGFVAESVAMLAVVKVAAEAGVLPGFKVETNPRSRRFGKIQTPSGDVDFLGGYSQIAATVAQMVTGEQKSRSGTIRPVGMPDDGRIEKVFDVFWDKFARSKAAPWPGMAWDVATGKTYTGERLSGDPDRIDQAIKERLLPLAVQDVIDGYLQSGFKGGVGGATAFAGVRMTSFQTLFDVKEDVAQEKFSKPYVELDRSQRAEVDNHSKVLDKDREHDLQYGDSFEQVAEQIKFERSQTENIAYARYQTQTDGTDRFIQRIEDAQKTARIATDREAVRLGITSGDKTSLLDQAYQQFIGLYDLADIGYEQGVVTNDIDWDRFNDLKEALYAKLSPEQVKFIEDKEPQEHDKSVEWYFNNKRYIKDSGYNGLTAAEFDRSPAAKQFGNYGELIAAEGAAKMAGAAEYRRLHAQVLQIQQRATAKKQALRRKDPTLDASLRANGVTETVLTAAAKRLLAQ